MSSNLVEREENGSLLDHSLESAPSASLSREDPHMLDVSIQMSRNGSPAFRIGTNMVSERSVLMNDRAMKDGNFGFVGSRQMNSGAQKLNYSINGISKSVIAQG